MSCSLCISLVSQLSVPSCVCVCVVVVGKDYVYFYQCVFVYVCVCVCVCVCVKFQTNVFGCTVVMYCLCMWCIHMCISSYVCQISNLCDIHIQTVHNNNTHTHNTHEITQIHIEKNTLSPYQRLGLILVLN